jgi:hypothetical protein
MLTAKLVVLVVLVVHVINGVQLFQIASAFPPVFRFFVNFQKVVIRQKTKQRERER